MDDDPGVGLSGPIWIQTPVPFERVLGFEVLGLTEDLARGRVRVTDRFRQMRGLAWCTEASTGL
ncbi:MAG: hypothetical protein M3R38_27110 [Actinomycetota bacterium]|nr:hypothetical protein [Actinomycetota bacterium]